MPQIDVVFFQNEHGQVPVFEWLQQLRARDRKGYAKCVARLRRLALLGHELRRPEADYLRDDIYELRAKFGRVNYRILYFFHGRTMAILAHALTKEDKLPDADIDRAVRRKQAFQRNPKRHSYEEELSDG
mgnify:CR=1 FL=1